VTPTRRHALAFLTAASPFAPPLDIEFGVEIHSKASALRDDDHGPKLSNLVTVSGKRIVAALH
jgi:hypothetical protein